MGMESVASKRLQIMKSWCNSEILGDECAYKYLTKNSFPLTADFPPKTRVLNIPKKATFFRCLDGMKRREGRLAGPFVTLFCRQIRLGGEGATCDFHRLFPHPDNIWLPQVSTYFQTISNKQFPLPLLSLKKIVFTFPSSQVFFFTTDCLMEPSPLVNDGYTVQRERIPILTHIVFRRDRFRCIWMWGVRIQSGLSRSTLHRQTFLLSS